MVRGIGTSKSKNVKRKKNPEKIQSREMERDIERSKDIASAYLQGGKAIGKITKKRLNKEKKKK